MSTINYGRIAITLRKDFTPGDEAIPLDAVFHDGSLWACIKRTSDLPAESSDGWMLAAQGVKLGGDNGVVVGPDGKITIQIQPGGGLGVDSNGQLYVDRSVFQALIQAGQGIDVAGDGTVSAKVQTGGGIEFDGSGRMFVTPNAVHSAIAGGQGIAVSNDGTISAKLQTNGGLGFDGSGQMFVNPASFSDSITDNMLRKLRLQKWLTQNTTWYVRTDGNDANDGGADTPERAFKTIQAAVNYVAENFNLGVYTATIKVGPGNFEPFVFPKYTATLGAMNVTGSGVDNSTIICPSGQYAVQVNYACIYSMSNFTINAKKDTDQFTCCIVALNGAVFNASRMNISLIETAITATQSSCCIRAFNSANIYLNENISLKLSSPANARMIVLDAFTNSGIAIQNNLTISGSYGFFARVGTSALIDRHWQNLPIITGTGTGKRYDVTSNGILRTHGAGPDYFPGTIAGTVTSGGQYI